MKTDTSFTLRLGGIVVLTAAAGLGVFFYAGSTMGVYALAGGIPLVVVSAAVFYARRERPSRSRDTVRYFEEKANSVGDRMRSLLVDYDRLDDRLDDWTADDVEDEIAYAVEQFEDAGVEFDRATNRYTVVGGGEVRDLERLDERVTELRETVAASAASHVEREREACRTAQRELADADLLDGVEQPPPVEYDGLDDLEDLVSAYDDRVADAVDEAVEELHDVAADTGYEGEAVDRGAGTARSAVDRGEYERATEALVDTRDALERDLSADFDAEREAVESLVETVSSSVARDHVRPGLVDDVAAVGRELDDVDDALDMATLEALASRARDGSRAVVEAMSDALAEDMDALSSSPVPDDYYEYQPAADEAYGSRLDAADDLDEFRREWLTAVGELSSALDAVGDKAAVAAAYGSVSDDIEETLRASGRVDGGDLTVKQPAEFMELYAAETDAATFEPSGPAVVASEFGETFTVEVTAGFEEGGPERPVTVELDGDSFEASETIETHLLDVVSFEDVPYGEYSVSVSTDEEGFETVEQSVTVEDDVSVEVRLSEVGLREAVCQGVEDDVQDAIDDAAPLFADRFADDEHLSAEMDFPMSDEYVPCLLAVWADDEGLAAVRDDGSVLVYDGDQFANRLTTIVEHNLGSGESMSYEKIRSQFLSVPASRDLVVETLRDTAVASTVELGADEITKQ